MKRHWRTWTCRRALGKTRELPETAHKRCSRQICWVVKPTHFSFMIKNYSVLILDIHSRPVLLYPQYATNQVMQRFSLLSWQIVQIITDIRNVSKHSQKGSLLKRKKKGEGEKIMFAVRIFSHMKNFSLTVINNNP